MTCALTVRAENIQSTVQELSDSFSNTPVDTQKAKKLTIQLRYFQNVEDVCREWQPGKRIELQH